MSEAKYEIVKKIGVLSTSAPALSRVEGSGWTKELNIEITIGSIDTGF